MHDGHRERMRKQFMEHGLGSFAPVNALEFLLFFSHKRGDTNAIAHRLLDRFGSFSGVLDAPYASLLEVEGVGPASAFLIRFVREAANFYAQDRTAKGVVISSTEEAGAYLAPRFVGRTNEEVHILLLDDKNKVLRCAKLFEGTVNAAPVTIKKVVSEVVATNATGVILAHNHPGGLALPSAQDKRSTYDLEQALQLMNVRLLDHIIFSDDDFVSLADSGALRYQNFN